MCAILIEFLDSLGEPVVPSDCYDKAMDCISLAQCKQLISNINSVHANVFYYLIAFLRQIIQKNSSLKTKLGNKKILTNIKRIQTNLNLKHPYLEEF